MFLFIGSKFYVSVSNRGKGENMDKEQLIEKAIKGDKKAFLALLNQTKRNFIERLFFIPKTKRMHFVQGMRVTIPEEGYEITMTADILSKEEMEKILLSMVE